MILLYEIIGKYLLNSHDSQSNNKAHSILFKLTDQISISFYHFHLLRKPPRHTKHYVRSYNQNNYEEKKLKSIKINVSFYFLFFECSINEMIYLNFQSVFSLKSAFDLQLTSCVWRQVFSFVKQTTNKKTQ